MSASPSTAAYSHARKLLHACSSPNGFLASPEAKANYRRVWARDGVIIGLASLMIDDAELHDTFQRTLTFLAAHQGPQGEIPSNVDGITGRISYGGTTGRVDADLWFIIGCGEYWRATGDDAFLKQMLPTLDRVEFLLGAWEYNNRGLLFVPPAGDWADEYIQSGYVLYDQLLYLQAQRTLVEVRRKFPGSEDAETVSRMQHLARLIAANYWFDDVDKEPEAVYHPILYRQGRDAPQCYCNHWVPFFSPHGYGFRFDAFANVLASLLDVADDTRREKVDDYISRLTRRKPKLLPAFHPVVKPVDREWKKLQINFSQTFRNDPYEYQNGGLWPMITGFHVADLARRGKTKTARRFRDGIDWANALPMNDEAWSFPEFVHGKKKSAGGTRHQGWSAAATVMAHRALQGQPLFRITKATASDDA